MKHSETAGRKRPQSPQSRKSTGSRRARPAAQSPGTPGQPGAEPGCAEPGSAVQPGTEAGSAGQAGQARVRAGSPGAILAVVPHLLGFAPEDSLVVLGTQPPSGEVKLSMRYDLPWPASEEVAADIADHALAVLASQRLTAAIAVGYGPDERVRPLIDALRVGAEEYRVELRECLRYDDGRYWSYTCRDPRCCPAGGTQFDPAGHPAGAAMTMAGEGVLPDRTSLAASIAPVGGIAAEAMREATGRAERHVTQVLAKVRRSSRIGAARHMIASEGLAAVAHLVSAYRIGRKYETDYQLAWLSVALKDVRVRDDAWARMDPKYREEHRRLWTDVVRRAQPGYVAAPASLLAFVAWQAGNGALANVALDRAQADDPEYSMAGLLRDVITAGAPPSMARLPMTPAEVAASYDAEDAEDAEDADNTDITEDTDNDDDGTVSNEHGAEDAPGAGDAPIPAMTGQTRLG